MLRLKRDLSIKEKYWFYGAGVFGLFFLWIYIQYSLKAWFYFDDFYFIDTYRNSLCVEDLIRPDNNMGRFFTRNLYWYLTFNLFGTASWAYFFINLIILIGNCILAYFLIKQLTGDRITACLAALLYFITPPTISLASWISNSQHIIGNTFVFLFLLYAIKSDFFIAANVKAKAVVLLLFVLGAYSASYIIFALPVLFCYLFINYDKKLFYKLHNLLLFGSMLFVACYILITLAKLQTSVYSTSFSLHAFLNTSQYYLKLLIPLGSGLLPSLLFVLPFCWVCFQMLKNRDQVLLLLLIACFCQYLPVAFLIFRQSLFLTSLPLFFFMSALLFSLRKVQPVIIILLILLIAVRSGAFALSSLDNPLGEKNRQFMAEFNKINTGEYKTILFRPINQNIVFNTPRFWNAMYFGMGLKLSNPDLFYELESKHTGSQQVMIITVDQNFKIQGIERK